MRILTPAPGGVEPLLWVWLWDLRLVKLVSIIWNVGDEVIDLTDDIRGITLTPPKTFISLRVDPLLTLASPEQFC
jgi:hypothetical protein